MNDPTLEQVAADLAALTGKVDNLAAQVEDLRTLAGRRFGVARRHLAGHASRLRAVTARQQAIVDRLVEGRMAPRFEDVDPAPETAAPDLDRQAGR